MWSYSSIAPRNHVASGRINQRFCGISVASRDHSPIGVGQRGEWWGGRGGGRRVSKWTGTIQHQTPASAPTEAKPKTTRGTRKYIARLHDKLSRLDSRGVFRLKSFSPIGYTRLERTHTRTDYAVYSLQDKKKHLAELPAVNRFSYERIQNWRNSRTTTRRTAKGSRTQLQMDSINVDVEWFWYTSQDIFWYNQHWWSRVP